MCGWGEVARSSLVQSSKPKIYHGTVDRCSKARSCAVAWLLCGLLVCAAIHSPHCDLCNELYFGGSSSQHVADHPVPLKHDECNGMCSCCLFQGLLPLTPVLPPAHAVTGGIWISLSGPVVAPWRSIFRPPRIVISA